MTTDSARDLALGITDGVAAEFKRRVREEYTPRVGRCVSLLSHEQIWHRPSEHNNSVANLLLHLEGNVRQWILSGIGGIEDRRERDAEFAAEKDTHGANGEELMAALEATVAEAVAVVDGLSPEDLLRVETFQTRWEHTCLTAVLHVMEHFSGHAGQIYAYTKQTLGIDLKFWDL